MQVSTKFSFLFQFFNDMVWIIVVCIPFSLRPTTRMLRVVFVRTLQLSSWHCYQIVAPVKKPPIKSQSQSQSMLRSRTGERAGGINFWGLQASQLAHQVTICVSLQWWPLWWHLSNQLASHCQSLGLWGDPFLVANDGDHDDDRGHIGIWWLEPSIV